MRFTSIAIPSAPYRAFTYLIPKGMDISAGARAVVPFRLRRVVGICIEASDEVPPEVRIEALREVERLVGDGQALDEALLDLVRWISAYYLAPIGLVCRAALPSRLLRVEAARPSRRPVAPIEIAPLHRGDFDLTADQRAALSSILAEPKGATLLQGITGSGKTEVYLEFFAELASRGKRGLLLVPEIALTPQLTGRAAARFGDRIAVYHSGLSDAQRLTQWMRMKEGEALLAIGTRSALFAPLPDLGGIVVDEEHDGSYKQEDGAAYSCRDAAVMRAHIQKIPIVLGSATPSLESLANAMSGKYRLLRLDARPGAARLPLVEIVDIRRATARHNAKGDGASEGMKRRRELLSLSPPLYDAIRETLDRGEQSLIYIGRRGFAAALQCSSCGEALRCPNCDISLALHGGKGRNDVGMLSCHYCGFASAEPKSCPSCGGAMMPIGHGTERVEAELKDFFPEAKIARFDSDAAGSAKRRQRVLHEMRRGEIDILVGTQMVTKGHDFPAVTLVGVIAADTILNLPDFRAAERTFQMLTQVAGRAGRGESPGRVIVQTRQPGHEALRAAAEHDVDSFAAMELGHRKGLSYPPFAKLANVRLSSLKERDVEGAAGRLASSIRGAVASIAGGKGLKLLGPAPAPIFKLKGRYRWQILIKSPTSDLMARFLNKAQPLLAEGLPRGVRVAVIVDPSSLL